MQKIKNKRLKSQVMERFLNKYVKEGVGYKDDRGNRILLGDHLKDFYYDGSVIIDNEDIPKIGLSQDLSIYVYFDRSEELIATTFYEFCEYLENRENWEYVDAEVFDESLDWLVVVTHDEVAVLFGFDDN